MEPHVGIGVDPVSPRRVATIDDGDRRIAMREKRVGKPPPCSPRPNDEIIGFDFIVHTRSPLERRLAMPC